MRSSIGVRVAPGGTADRVGWVLMAVLGVVVLLVVFLAAEGRYLRHQADTQIPPPKPISQMTPGERYAACGFVTGAGTGIYPPPAGC